MDYYSKFAHATHSRGLNNQVYGEPQWGGDDFQSPQLVFAASEAGPPWPTEAWPQSKHPLPISPSEQGPAIQADSPMPGVNQGQKRRAACRPR
jgi:hypothetical protein